MYVKGVFTGFQRGKSTQRENYALIKIKGVETPQQAAFYFGKKAAYIFKAKTMRNNTRFRVIWGKVAKSHGTNGLVRAKFRKNLPPRAMGAQIRVMLYPNRKI